MSPPFAHLQSSCGRLLSNILGSLALESYPFEGLRPSESQRQRERKYWSVPPHTGAPEVRLARCAYCEYFCTLYSSAGQLCRRIIQGVSKELAAPLHGFHSINTEQGQHPTTKSFRAPQHVSQSRNDSPALIFPGLLLPRAPHSPSWVPCLFLYCLFSQFIPARPDTRAACLSLISKRETFARGSSTRQKPPQSCPGVERHSSIQG